MRLLLLIILITIISAGPGYAAKRISDNTNTATPADAMEFVGQVPSGDDENVTWGTMKSLLGEIFVETETDPVTGAITGIVKANGAGNISAAVAGTDYITEDHLPFVDVTLNGVVGDGSTDNSAAVQALVDAGAQTLYFPPSANTYKFANINVNRSLAIMGGGPETFLELNAAGYMFKFTAHASDSTKRNKENNNPGVMVANLYAIGVAKSYLAPAVPFAADYRTVTMLEGNFIEMSDVDHFTLSNLWIEHFKGSAVDFKTNCREGIIHNVKTRYMGDETNSKPIWDLVEENTNDTITGTAVDAHNNIYFSQVIDNYPFYHVRHMDTLTATSRVRNIFVSQSMGHGFISGADGSPYTLGAVEKNIPLDYIKNVETVKYIQTRWHAAGWDEPSVRIVQHTIGSTDPVITFVDCQFNPHNDFDTKVTGQYPGVEVDGAVVKFSSNDWFANSPFVTDTADAIVYWELDNADLGSNTASAKNGTWYEPGTASGVSTSTASFNGNLSGTDTTVQAALDTLDDMSAGTAVTEAHVGVNKLAHQYVSFEPATLTLFQPATPNGTVARDTTDYVFGEASLKFTATAADNTVYLGESNTDYNITIPTAKTFRLSLWVKASSTGDNQIFLRGNESGSFSPVKTVNVTSINTWEWHSVDIDMSTAANDASTACILRIDNDQGNTETLFIDGLLLEEITAGRTKPGVISIPENLIKETIDADGGTVTVDMVQNGLLSNYGMSGADRTWTLPDAAAGMHFKFVLSTDPSTFNVIIDPEASDIIYLSGTSLSVGEAVVSTGNSGDWIEFFSFKNASGAYSWIATPGQGTWTEETP